MSILSCLLFAPTVAATVYHALVGYGLPEAMTHTGYTLNITLSFPCDACLCGMQASLRAGQGVEGALEGWHVEACSTHVAVTCPSTAGPCTRVLVYAFQVCLGPKQLLLHGLIACLTAFLYPCICICICILCLCMSIFIYIFTCT